MWYKLWFSCKSELCGNLKTLTKSESVKWLVFNPPAGSLIQIISDSWLNHSSIGHKKGRKCPHGIRLFYISFYFYLFSSIKWFINIYICLGNANLEWVTNCSSNGLTLPAGGLKFIKWHMIESDPSKTLAYYDSYHLFNTFA